MIRAFLEESLLFLAPFAVFALFLVLRRRNPLALEFWSERTVMLALAGLFFVAIGLVAGAILGDRPTGAFEPAHEENGHIVPGRFR